MNIQSPLALLLLALVGCTEQVSSESSTTGAGGGQTTGAGVGGGQTTGAGGAGGGSSACAKLPEDGVVWGIDFADGEHLDPSITKAKIGEVRDETFEGNVVEATPGHLTIDTCPPNADCVASLVKIDVAQKLAPFDIGIPLHTFVHVHLVSMVIGYPPGGQAPFRTLLLQIDNLATWGGVPSAIEPGSNLWLIASAAGLSVQGNGLDSLGVSKDSICPVDGSGLGGRVVLKFWDLATPSTKLTLHQGESGSLATTVSTKPLMVTNVDSSQEQAESAWAPDYLVRRAHPED